MAARKKTRRKGTKKAGKKSPSKPAGKKKPKKKASVAAKPKEFIIKLMSNDQGVDSQPRPSRKRHDIVMWVNDGTVERRLTFGGGVWPFEGARCDIVVPLHGATGWYRVEKRTGETGVTSYTYSSTPAFASGGPPGDPVMDTGD